MLEQYLTAELEVLHQPDFEYFERLDNKERDQELERERNQWQRVVEKGRQYLGECPDIGISTETDVLEKIAEGLERLGQKEDAVPILKRCIAVDAEKSVCWHELGEVEEFLCRFDEAKEAFQRVIEIGAFTKLNEILVKSSKSFLSYLEDPTFLANFRARWCPGENSNSANVSSGAKRFGSGFFVTRQGEILTNNHVVEGCTRLTTSDGKSLTVVDRDAKVDLALLKGDMSPEAVATLRSGAPPKQGDQVIAFAFPLPDVLSSEGNVSTGILSAMSGLHNDIRFVQISAPIQPGSSGGPLLDGSGHVIGVVVAKLDALQVAKVTGDVPQNVNFAIHWTEVRRFLEERGVAYQHASSSSHTETREITAEARRFSVGIVCTE